MLETANAGNNVELMNNLNIILVTIFLMENVAWINAVTNIIVEAYKNGPNRADSKCSNWSIFKLQFQLKVSIRKNIYFWVQ